MSMEVEVLFDYSYHDDQGLVEIRQGEKYRLIEKTNGEWWHVCEIDQQSADLDEDLEGFFVPAQYVRVLKTTVEDDVSNASSRLDNALDEESRSAAAANISALTKIEKGENPQQNGKGKSTDCDMDYVNLDQYRAKANIPAGCTQREQDMDYANLPFQLHRQHIPEHEERPLIQDGTFVRVLREDLPWDVYEDKSKRKFFHNRETGELTWKPPRKDKPSSPAHIPDAPFESQGSSGLGHSQSEKMEYTRQEESGSVFFVNNSTKEKWQQLVDTSGQQYFHRLGSTDTMWELPGCVVSSDMPQVKEIVVSGQASLDKEEGGSHSAINRQSKSKSMYGKIEHGPSPAADSKTCTLPHNFSPSSQMEKSPSLPSFQAQEQDKSQHRTEEEHLQGYLNKAKITDTGKRKIKKNWTPVYVVLQATNLVFYKDQKAVAQKQGSPHGRTEQVHSLSGAKVDFNLPKDVTSRRNSIMVTTQSGSHFLLHSDDEKKIHEWLVALKLAANDIKQEYADRNHNGKDGSFVKRGASRSMSEGGGSQGGELDRGKNNLVGIKTRLLNLLTRRPTQEELVKQGIIKDAVFGSSLRDLCERDKCAVPNFVVECITAVENKGLEHDGLYRISGNLAEIQRLRYVVDKNDDNCLADDPQWDVHTLTGALKLFFRELREPLFTFQSVHKFIDAIKRESRKDKLKGMQDALATLPKCHCETMRVLFQHLQNVIQFSSENRMQTQNIAIVFGPTLMWLGEEDFNKMAVFTIYQSKVVEFILLEYKNIFRH